MNAALAFELRDGPPAAPAVTAPGSRASAAARRYGRFADLPNAPAAHAALLILPIDMCTGMRYRKP